MRLEGGRAGGSVRREGVERAVVTVLAVWGRVCSVVQRRTQVPARRAGGGRKRPLGVLTSAADQVRRAGPRVGQCEVDAAVRAVVPTREPNATVPGSRIGFLNATSTVTASGSRSRSPRRNGPCSTCRARSGGGTRTPWRSARRGGSGCGRRRPRRTGGPGCPGAATPPLLGCRGRGALGGRAASTLPDAQVRDGLLPHRLAAGCTVVTRSKTRPLGCGRRFAGGRGDLEPLVRAIGRCWVIEFSGGRCRWPGTGTSVGHDPHVQRNASMCG